MLQCDFQAVYASGIHGKAGLSPDKLADDLGPLFESIIRCIPGPRIKKDGSLQMLVSFRLFFQNVLPHFFIFFYYYKFHFSILVSFLRSRVQSMMNTRGK